MGLGHFVQSCLIVYENAIAFAQLINERYDSSRRFVCGLEEKMQHLDEKDYSARDLLVALQKEASSAVDYIDFAIKDYDHVPNHNDIFKDVLRIEGYQYSSNPEGCLRESTWGRHGVYVFVVNEDFDLSGPQVSAYCDKCHGAGFKSRGAVSLRKGQHFYQGSVTSNSFHTRLKEHYSSGTDISALQLNNRYRSIVKDKLVVFVFPMVASLEHRPFFIKMIENDLHQRFPAITGSSRV